MELDGNFEPQVDDLMDEDPSLQDDDWEPRFKRPRIKKESTSIGVCGELTGSSLVGCVFSYSLINPFNTATHFHIHCGYYWVISYSFRNSCGE